MVDREHIDRLINSRLTRLLLVAETALPASRFQAFRKIVLDEFGKSGLGKELDRTFSKEKDRHGTFKDCEKLLPRVSDMGFDVLYFPPVHPIGEVNRKGKNNTNKKEYLQYYSHAGSFSL